MKTLCTSLFGMVLATASTAVALDQPFIDQLMTSAKTIEMESRGVHQALAKKSAAFADISPKLDAISTNVNRLQELVKSFEATNPQLSERDRNDWHRIKEKVQLIEIFHGRKNDLASQDLAKNRGLIRAHAQGVAYRAAKLQEAAVKLRRAPNS